MKFIYNLKWMIAVFLFAVFCRIFLISVYKISTKSMNPVLISGDVIISNQISYGFKFPWMRSGYFESSPIVGDIVVIQIKNKLVTEHSVQRIVQKTSESLFVVKADSESVIMSVYRDQIIGKAWFIVLSAGTTQDSISAEKSIRWNRFLTMIH